MKINIPLFNENQKSITHVRSFVQSPFPCLFFAKRFFENGWKINCFLSPPQSSLITLLPLWKLSHFSKHSHSSPHPTSPENLFILILYTLQFCHFSPLLLIPEVFDFLLVPHFAHFNLIKHCGALKAHKT